MAHCRKYKTPKGEIRWRAEIRVKGTQQVSKSFIRRDDAKAWGRIQEEKLQRFGAGIQQNTKYTIDEAFERYAAEHLPTLTDKTTIQGMINWWRMKIGARILNGITPHEIIKLRHQLSSEPIYRRYHNSTTKKMLYAPDGSPRCRQPRTVQGYINCLSHLYVMAMREWGWVSKNPVKQVKPLKINNARYRFLSDHYHLWQNENEPRHWDDLTANEKLEAKQKFPRAYELPRLVEALKAQVSITGIRHSNPLWAYYLFTIQFGAGLRLSEATHMVWEENDQIKHPIVIVDMVRKELILKSTKHDPTPRIKPLCGEVLDVLKALYNERRTGTPLVFPRADGQKPLEFRKRILRAIADAGLQDFHWHDIRHTTASYLSMMGASDREIMEALHHRNIQSSQRYTHISNSHLRGLMERFSETVMETTQSPSRFVDSNLRNN